MKLTSLLIVTLGGFAFAGTSLAQVYEHHLAVATNGHAEFSWNSRYGGDAYGNVNGATLRCYTSFYSGVPSDTEYTVGIFMIPLASLAGGELSSARLDVNVVGFSTWYFSGRATASLGWLNTSTLPSLTGNVVADGLGPLAKSRPGGYLVYDSYVSGSGAAGPLSFDVTSVVLTDLNAGRAYSSFVLSSSRDTSGSLQATASQGPVLVAFSTVPEPARGAFFLGLLACMAVVGRRGRLG